MTEETEPGLSAGLGVKQLVLRVSATALAQSVEFDEEMKHVFLTDGRVVSVPIIWFSVLYEATLEQRTEYEIGGGISLHWPELDEGLLVANLMAGVDWESVLLTFPLPAL